MKSLITILALLLLLAAQGQSSAHFRLSRSYAASVADAQTDHLGNLYLISENGGITKRSAAGDSLAVFNGVRRFGKLFSLDVSNPLKMVLLYKDFAQIAVLDRFLAQQFVLDLRRIGVQQPSAAALSYDNKIWVFDALSNKLKKLDDAGNLLLETPDLRTLFPGGLQPERIFEQNNWVYLHDTAQGLFVFDYYGNFKRKIPVAGWSNVFVSAQNVYGIKDGQLFIYALNTLMQDQKSLPEEIKTCSRVRVAQQKLIAVCPEGVRVYEMQ